MAKSKFVIVACQSLVTKHRFTTVRPRNGDKVKLLKWDPMLQAMAVYEEVKKIKGAKH